MKSRLWKNIIKVNCQKWCMNSLILGINAGNLKAFLNKLQDNTSFTLAHFSKDSNEPLSLSRTNRRR